MKAILIVLGVCALIVVVLVAVFIAWMRKMAPDTSDVFKEYPTSIEEILAQPEELDIIIALHQKTDQKAARSGLDSLTEAERILLCFQGIELDVNNGGFHQYFFNSSGDSAQDAPAAFRAIGADHTAGIIAKACSVFPDGKPPKDREERQLLLRDIGEEAEQLLDQLNDEFFEYRDDLSQLLVEYIRKHEDDFRD